MQSYRPPGHFPQTTLEFFATHHSPFWRFGEHARITFQIRHQSILIDGKETPWFALQDNWLIFTPTLGTQKEGYSSDIERKHVDYGV